jgi:predicted nucleic acid-binding protein
MTSAIKLPRVVIDTNRILSAVVFAQGRLTPLRLAWQGKRIQPLVCKDTAAELIRVLACPKFKLSAEDQQELLADYLTCCRRLRRFFDNR